MSETDAHPAEGESDAVADWTNPTRRGALDEAVQRLEAAGVSNARKNAEWLLADALGCNTAALYAHPERVIEADRLQAFASMVARRADREPLQYILGHTDFYGLTLDVNPQVLIPRPETEEVVEHALGLIDHMDRPRVLDVGTGSGCIALAIKHQRPDAEVHACDVSDAALSVARRNADRHDLEITCIEADVLADDFADRVPHDLDLLISNPPYIPDDEAADLAPEVGDHEPALALLTGNDPLIFYRALAKHALNLLAPGGWFAVETHERFADHVRALVQEIQLVDHQLKHDLSERARMVMARNPTDDEQADPLSQRRVSPRGT